MCDFHEHCHGEKAPAVNCRTCAHSTAELDGDSKWSCQHIGHDIGLIAQRMGCPSHRYIPILLEKFATQTDYVNGDVVYTDGTGATFANGEAPGALTSQEIRDLEQKTMLGDVAAMKSQLAAQGIDSKVVA
jgi:hypothetical protein